jgi:hypothetical protein
VNLVVHIERVVLEGPELEGMALDGHQRDQLRLRLEQELVGHLTGRALSADLATGAAVPRLNAGPVQLDPAGAARPGGATADLARQVAGSVATSLAGPPIGGRR